MKFKCFICKSTKLEEVVPGDTQLTAIDVVQGVVVYREAYCFRGKEHTTYIQCSNCKYTLLWDDFKPVTTDNLPKWLKENNMF